MIDFDACPMCGGETEMIVAWFKYGRFWWLNCQECPYGELVRRYS